MAKPRIFISSTFFDLRHVREDLKRFIASLGYEAVLAEHGHIPYGNEEPLEEYCYREISNCDVVVVVLGGRAGSLSVHEPNTIVENELRQAIDECKQIYFFVDQNVQAEYETWLVNKDTGVFVPRHADSCKVYEVLDYVKKLGLSNPLFPFETTEDLIGLLREQFAGLFQRLLTMKSEAQRAVTLQEIKALGQALKDTVSFLATTSKEHKDILDKISMLNHPAHRALQSVLQTPYPTFFKDYKEMDAFLKARNWKRDRDAEPDDVFRYIAKTPNTSSYIIDVSIVIFDEEDEYKLKVYNEDQWLDGWIKKYDPGFDPFADD